MSDKLKAAIFDVDGVLLDTLAPHLQICRDKSEEYDLNLEIPDGHQIKQMIRRGVRVSPMDYFFLAVGFPKEYAKKAFEQYKQVFMEKYTIEPFMGVHDMLSRLRSSGLNMGIVTSNYRMNIEQALGESIDLFNPECIYTKDYLGDTSKAQALKLAMDKLSAGPDEAIYIGDQPADWEAARTMRLSFLGVTYGWGISELDSSDFPTVDSVQAIGDYILGK